MNFSDLRNGLRENLLTVCDNVTEYFIHPVERAEQQADFPYITFVFGSSEIEGGKRYRQNISIIGFVKGKAEEIPDKLITLKNDIYNSIYNKDPKIIIESYDLTNVFAPFGFDSFIAPPYGGVRYECYMPGVIPTS